MSQQEKGELWRKLKDAGVKPSKHYRDYTTEDLRAAVGALEEAQPEPGPQPAPPPPDPADEVSAEDAAAFFGGIQQAREEEPDAMRITATPGAERMPVQAATPPPVAAADPHEMPGQRLNQQEEWEPIRTDEEGRIWYQEEVLKPSFAKPRGRRVLQYTDTGVQTKTVKDEKGFVETFEVAGTMQRRPSEVKITLPSYQVGIYKDRRFPFKIHTYAGRQGFDLDEVQNYYGGAELVPETVKKEYVENVLCYNIRTVVRAIEFEYRQLQLQGKVR